MFQTFKLPIVVNKVSYTVDAGATDDKHVYIRNDNTPISVRGVAIRFTLHAYATGPGGEFEFRERESRHAITRANWTKVSDQYPSESAQKIVREAVITALNKWRKENSAEADKTLSVAGVGRYDTQIERAREDIAEHEKKIAELNAQIAEVESARKKLLARAAGRA